MGEIQLVYGPFLEIWKPIKGYTNYDISSYGRVKSFKRGRERILKPALVGKSKNYKCVSIFKNNKGVTHTIHRLVAQYIPNPYNLPQLNHIDGDSLNNHNLNLEWVSISENNCHRQDKTKTSSQYIGVSWNKNSKKWQSDITINSKSIYLGLFHTELEAYIARCNYEQNNNIINKYL